MLATLPFILNSIGTQASESEAIFLSVDKKTLTADLKTLPEDFSQSRTLRQFKIAIGKNEGDKEKSGDNKTPEGIYFAQSAITAGVIPKSKYGPGAIPLNFPNPFDHYEGKSGHGIWLHGAGENRRIEEAKITEGCVAFHNEEVFHLMNWLQPFQGLVVITADATVTNRPLDIAEVRKRTLGWINAWTDRNLPEYTVFYADEFSFEGKNKKAYSDYKDAVFKLYKNIQLKVGHLRVLVHEKYALTIMDQDFRGDDRYVSDGRKILYWQKNQKTRIWEIIRENFEGRRFEFVKLDSTVLGSTSQNISHP